MNRRNLAVFAILAIIIGCNKESKKSDETKISEKTSESNKIAYSLGVQYAKGLKDLSFDENDQEFFLRGIADHFGQKTQLDNNDIQVYAQKSDGIRQENRKATAASEKDKGKAAVENLIQDNQDYKTHPSGLVYKVEEMGTKVENPKQSSFIGMSYESSHLDDKVYESTMSGNPRVLPLKGIFKAWQVAFSIVGEGGEITIISPPELTYGDSGALPYVAPGEYLKFKIKFGKYYASNPAGN